MSEYTSSRVREESSHRRRKNKRRKRKQFFRKIVRTIVTLVILYGIFLLGLAIVKKMGIGTQSVFSNSNTVVLDAGHGGKDSGAISGQIYEKDINLAVVTKLQKLLKKEKIHVVLTREDDTFLELSERTDISNKVRPALFVSIHCNSVEQSSSVSGLECYYEEGSSQGEQYANMLWSSLEKQDNISCHKMMAEDYYVLRNNTSPALLIELGYLSNSSEKNNLTSDSYQDALAQAIADAIVETLHHPN